MLCGFLDRLLPLAYTATGRRDDAVAAMDYIVDHFFRASDAGDGCDGGNAALGWMGAYQPAWACVTAVQPVKILQSILGHRVAHSL